MGPVSIVDHGGFGHHEYFLEHDFDLMLVANVPEEGPYPSYEDAEAAAEQILVALSGC